MMEEFHLTVFAPRGLPALEYDTMRQTLDDPHFHAELDRAVRGRRPPAPGPEQDEGAAVAVSWPSLASETAAGLSDRPLNVARRRPPGIRQILAFRGMPP